MDDISYIIVQAGGKGTRMEKLTRNKPKALVPINNLPMLFHLFRKYRDKKFIVIGDYKYDVLERYLKAFAEVDYRLVNAAGSTGTCAGLREAVELLPDDAPFMLIWSDLVLPAEFELPVQRGNYVGVAKDFPCRWQYRNGAFKEERSDEFGVAGMFIFEGRTVLDDVPHSGEFVRWLSEGTLGFCELPLYRTKEYGLISEYNKLAVSKCRPFNQITIEGNMLVKEGIDEQGRELAKDETAWYQRVMDKHFAQIPQIYSLSPLKMELVEGKNIYEYGDIPLKQKRDILKQIITCLKQVQALESVPADWDSYYEAYIGKTLKRLEKVRTLVPFADDETIVINGRACRNVFYHVDELKEKVAKYYPTRFKLIHGDCTFSNSMLRKDGTPVLIDPRGYFGKTKLYGDPAYDWVKLYYSVVGNYDQFNLKRFALTINEHDVDLQIDSNHWEELEDYYFELLTGEVTREQIHLFHAITWLSLAMYAWENYDSICGAFYNGLYYLEETL